MREDGSEQLQAPDKERGHGEVEDDDDDAYRVGTAGHHDSRHREHGADGIDGQHDATLVEARFHQAVVDMPLVGCADGDVLAFAADDGRERVEHRNARDDDRHGHGSERGRAHDAHERDDAKQEAKCERAAIAHEQLRRVEVESEECQAHAHAHERDERRGRTFLHECQDKERAERDGAHTRRQAVEAVDEVNNVGEGNEPDDGDGPGEDTQLQEVRATEHADF